VVFFAERFSHVGVGGVVSHVTKDVLNPFGAQRLNICRCPAFVPNLEVAASSVRSKTLHPERLGDARTDSPRSLFTCVMVEVANGTFAAVQPRCRLIHVGTLVSNRCCE